MIDLPSGFLGRNQIEGEAFEHHLVLDRLDARRLSKPTH
jgi:hypothetical protein